MSVLWMFYEQVLQDNNAFMSELWENHERLMSGNHMILKEIWTSIELRNRVLRKSMESRITFSSLILYSLGHLAKHLGEKNKAFMSELWEGYERLLSGRPNDSQGNQESLRISKWSSCFSMDTEIYSTQNRQPSCQWTCEAHRLWVVHERFMRGLWVAHA